MKIRKQKTHPSGCVFWHAFFVNNFSSLRQTTSSRAKCGLLCARSAQTLNLCVCSSRPYKALSTPCLTGSSSLKSVHVTGFITKRLPFNKGRRFCGAAGRTCAFGDAPQQTIINRLVCLPISSFSHRRWQTNRSRDFFHPQVRPDYR